MESFHFLFLNTYLTTRYSEKEYLETYLCPQLTYQDSSVRGCYSGARYAHFFTMIDLTETQSLCGSRLVVIVQCSKNSISKVSLEDANRLRLPVPLYIKPRLLKVTCAKANNATPRTMPTRTASICVPILLILAFNNVTHTLSP